MATLLKNHTLIDENRESTNRTAGHSHQGTKIKFLESRATGKKKTLEFNSPKWNVKRYLRGIL